MQTLIPFFYRPRCHSPHYKSRLRGVIALGGRGCVSLAHLTGEPASTSDLDLQIKSVGSGGPPSTDLNIWTQSKCMDADYEYLLAGWVFYYVNLVRFSISLQAFLVLLKEVCIIELRLMAVVAGVVNVDTFLGFYLWFVLFLSFFHLFCSSNEGHRGENTAWAQEVKTLLS